MKILPMTPLVTLGTAAHPIRIAPLDFNWQPTSTIQEALLALRAASAPAAVLLLHSSSMFVRLGRARLLYRVANERKLAGLLGFLRAEGFETTTVANVCEAWSWDRCPPAEDAIHVVSSVRRQYGILLFQSLVGFGISVKFCAFLVAHALLAVAVLAALAFLVLSV
jgi:hypothetical protein